MACPGVVDVVTVSPLEKSDFFPLSAGINSSSVVSPYPSG